MATNTPKNPQSTDIDWGFGVFMCSTLFVTYIISFETRVVNFLINILYSCVTNK